MQAYTGSILGRQLAGKDSCGHNMTHYWHCTAFQQQDTPEQVHACCCLLQQSHARVAGLEGVRQGGPCGMGSRCDAAGADSKVEWHIAGCCPARLHSQPAKLACMVTLALCIFAVQRRHKQLLRGKTGLEASTQELNKAVQVETTSGAAEVSWPMQKTIQ